MSGMIVGGMEYVWAAYGITAVALTVYIGSVIARYRRSLRNEAGRGAPLNG